MLLIRFSNCLSKSNKNYIKLFKQSSVYYSDDSKESSDGEKSKKSSGSDASKDDKPKPTAAPLPDENRKRLNDLLKNMSSRSNLAIAKAVQTSKPLGYKKLKQIQKPDKEERRPRNIVDAADAVAKEIGDESVKDDLLSSMDSVNKSAEFIDDVIAKLKTPAKRRKETSDKPLTGAFSAENKPRENAYRTRKPIGSTTPTKVPLERRNIQKKQEEIQIKDLFGAEPLGIFTDAAKLKENDDSLTTWSKLEKHEVRLHMSYAPRNYFEKMAYWTEQGKVWHFPIDNEQGLDEENNTSFVDHIFLDEYLEPWCPKRGAIRHFMELICVGLSKNPYYTVQQKREHIEWYRDYFAAKKDILERVIEENKTEQINKVTDGTSPQA